MVFDPVRATVAVAVVPEVAAKVTVHVWVDEPEIVPPLVYVPDTIASEIDVFDGRPMSGSEPVPVKLVAFNAAAAVPFPALSTFHCEVPPTCKSCNSEPVPDAVLVTFTNNAASTTPVVFQVGVIDNAGSVWEPVSELLTLNGIAVDPARAVAASSMSPVPVAAVVSPIVSAVTVFEVRAQFQICEALLPLAMVFDPVAAVMEESAGEPPLPAVAHAPSPRRNVELLQVPVQSPITSEFAALLRAPVVVVFLTMPVPKVAQF
jgi:hypothetical protein